MLEDKINETLKPLLDEVKKKCFVDGYEAGDVEALGLVLSKYLKWDGHRIMFTALASLEDANYHGLHDVILKSYKDWQNEPSEMDWNNTASSLHY